MSQITKTSLALALVVLAFLGVLSLAGCGDKNKASDYDPDIGKHPADWLPTRHGQAALEHIETCRPCHGDDFTGGISKVACTQCHLGGVGGFTPFGIGSAESQIHGPLGYYYHAIYVNQHGATGCATTFCHGVNLKGGTGPACDACHMQPVTGVNGPFSVHPLEWRDQITLHGGFVLQHGASACRNAVCHGPQLQGVFLSGPACNDCHNFTTTQLNNF